MPLLLLHVVLLIAIIHGTPAILYGTLEYSWAWKHVAIVDYIQRHGSVNPNLSVIDAYHNWPGSFALGTHLTEVAGFNSALDFQGHLRQSRRDDLHAGTAQRRTMTRSRCWPLVIVASASGTALAMAGHVGPPLQALIAFWFLLVCPGMAFVPLLRLAGRLTDGRWRLRSASPWTQWWPRRWS